jgi:pimeloyl-ACP methyl ester carboxylesterase
MTTITVNDTTLHYERTGEGPAVLFVHGMCGSADSFADQAQRLSDRATCVRYDRRGHTRSERGDGEISDAAHAADAATLIEALGLAPCLLVGSSGGAAIAVEVARRHGHLLRGAVFSEPPLFSLDPEAGQAFLAEVGPRVERALAGGDRQAWVDAFFAFVCPGLWTELDEAGRDRFRANADVGLEDLESPALTITAADLASATTPALVLAGTRSHPAFRSVAHALAAALPDARYVELEGSGHVTYFEQPDAFAAALAAFATELDRTAGPR